MTTNPRGKALQEIQAPNSGGASRAPRLLRQHYEESQIVELACVVGLFNYLNRFAEAFGMWPTRPGEGGPDEA